MFAMVVFRGRCPEDVWRGQMSYIPGLRYTSHSPKTDTIIAVGSIAVLLTLAWGARYLGLEMEL